MGGYVMVMADHHVRLAESMVCTPVGGLETTQSASGIPGRAKRSREVKLTG